VFGAHSSASVRLRQSYDPGSAAEEVPLATPAAGIPGTPGAWRCVCSCVLVRARGSGTRRRLAAAPGCAAALLTPPACPLARAHVGRRPHQSPTTHRRPAHVHVHVHVHVHARRLGGRAHAGGPAPPADAGRRRGGAAVGRAGRAACAGARQGGWRRLARARVAWRRRRRRAADTLVPARLRQAAASWCPGFCTHPTSFTTCTHTHAHTRIRPIT
jgi:hypothetical protein